MKSTFRLVMAALFASAMPSFASVILTDGTWYNFQTVQGEDLGAGVDFAYNWTSWSGVYEDPGAPPWTFTALAPGARLTVVDGGELGDQYEVYNFGQPFAPPHITTEYDVNEIPHQCGPYPTNPTTCFADPLMSKGEWILPAGDYSLTIKVNSSEFENSFESWFRVQQLEGTESPGGPVTSTVPEPGSMALMGLGLTAIGLFTRRSKKA